MWDKFFTFLNAISRFTSGEIMAILTLCGLFYLVVVLLKKLFGHKPCIACAEIQSIIATAEQTNETLSEIEKQLTELNKKLKLHIQMEQLSMLEGLDDDTIKGIMEILEK